jgi:hypothetical protein
MKCRRDTLYHDYSIQCNEELGGKLDNPNPNVLFSFSFIYISKTKNN